MKKKNPSFTPMSECACTKQVKLKQSMQQPAGVTRGDHGPAPLGLPTKHSARPHGASSQKPLRAEPNASPDAQPTAQQPATARRQRHGLRSESHTARTQPPPIGRRAPRVPGEPEPSRTWPPRRGRRRLFISTTWPPIAPSRRDRTEPRSKARESITSPIVTFQLSGRHGQE